MNEPNQKPLDHKKMNELNQKPLNHENMNELNQEPLDDDTNNELDQEPPDHDKKNESNPNPLDYDTNNEPDQEPLENDKSADQLGSNRNFVGKIKNKVKNVSKYFKSSGNPVFVWGIPEIEPQTYADANTGANTSANTGAGQHATNGSNAANEELDLLTTIHITQKQLDKRLHCTVCLDEYELDEGAMKLTCGHIFHEKCITHWIIMHGTCPICRRYFCPGELHLPRERVSVFRSIVRRVHRTLRSPLFYFFPNLEYAEAANDRRRTTPMYRLVRSERVISPLEPAESESNEMIEDYIFCHVMFVLQNTNNKQRPGSPNTIAANMRRRFSRLHRESNENPGAAGENSLPQQSEFHASENPPTVRPEFHFPADVISTEYLGHY